MRTLILAAGLALAACSTPGTPGAKPRIDADQAALYACGAALVGAETFAAIRAAGVAMSEGDSRKAGVALALATSLCGAAGASSPRAEEWAALRARLTAANVVLAGLPA